MPDAHAAHADPIAKVSGGGLCFMENHMKKMKMSKIITIAKSGRIKSRLIRWYRYGIIRKILAAK